MTIWCNTCRCLVRAPCTSHRRHRPVEQRRSFCRSFRSVVLFLPLSSPQVIGTPSCRQQRLTDGLIHLTMSHMRIKVLLSFVNYFITHAFWYKYALFFFLKKTTTRKQNNDQSRLEMFLSGFFSSDGGCTDCCNSPFVGSWCKMPWLFKAVKGCGLGQPPCVCDTHTGVWLLQNLQSF